jgi:hypothetical protein
MPSLAAARPAQWASQRSALSYRGYIAEQPPHLLDPLGQPAPLGRVGLDGKGQECTHQLATDYLALGRFLRLLNPPAA